MTTILIRRAMLALGLWLGLTAQTVTDRTPQADAVMAALARKAEASDATKASAQDGVLRSGPTLSVEEARAAAAPQDRAALAAYAGWLFAQQRFDDSAALSWKLYRSADNAKARGGALTLLAESRLATGGYEEAVAAYRLATGADPANARIKKRLAALLERKVFRIDQVTLDSERELAQACITFSDDIRQPIRAEDYLKVEPRADVDVYATGNRLCARGLMHGQSYKLTARPGISGVKGGTMRETDTREVQIGNRLARIQLGDGRYVLPRTGQNRIPVRSVNVGTIKLSLHAVNERALTHALSDRNFNQSLDTYSLEQFRADTGREIWKGSVTPEQKLNREVTTLLSLETMLKGRPSGLYMLTAVTPDQKPAPPEDEENDYYEYSESIATQWVIVSDIGLLSMQGGDGLTVFTRSLATGSPLADVTLELIARDNSVLGTARTNAEGKARFFPGLLRGTGAAEPMFVLAKAGRGDINLLRLTGPALDLSERGVEGEPAIRTAMDAYAYPERGIYRPGETVKLSALLRDEGMKAVPALPLFFIVKRPDGSELMRMRCQGDALGAYALNIALPAGARSGGWSVEMMADPKGESLGSTSFQVQDFVPQRIELSAKPSAPQIGRGAPLSALLNARYYYGPPAADLNGEYSSDVVRDDAPFNGYEGWQFGRIEESFSPVTQKPQAFATDAKGDARIDAVLGDIPATSQPLKARTGITLFDVGGRPVYTQVQAKLRTQPLWIGLRQKSVSSQGDTSTVTYDAVALDADGKPVAGRSIDVQWLKEDYDYSWYQENGRWYSRTSVFDTLAKAATATTGADGRTTLKAILAGGRYRLQLRDARSDAISSQRFYAGWWSSGETSNAPDALEVNLEKNDLADGDSLNLFVKAPFDGPALVTVAGTGVRFSTEARVSKAGNRISLPVNRDWGAGAYVMVTGFRPNAGAVSPLPVRAMGLAWFGIDQKKRTLAVTIPTPKAVEPRQKITLPVEVAGASGTVGMTIAAVDEGILALTRFASPKPEKHYLARRTLGLDVRDLYGQLIEPANGMVGKLREGGDAAMENATGITTRSTKAVALYTRQVTLDSNGKGSVTLDLPDFAGRLRLMAVAWTEAQVGSGEANLVVRDPVVAELTLPRFIAPGDSARATLSLHNVSGKAQTVSLSLAGTGLSLVNPLKQAITLKDGEQRRFDVPLSASLVGDGKAVLKASVGGKVIERSWDLAVRPVTTVESRRQLTLLDPGKTTRFTRDMLKGFVAGSTRASLTIGVRPDFDVPALLDMLDTYPYGCAEQITSIAMPLIYFNDVAALWDRKADANSIRKRVEDAGIRLLERQDYRGGIGLWRAGDTVDAWVSAYVYDFLTRSRAAGNYVPAQGYENLKKYLQGITNGEGGKGVDANARAYALYALARSGDAPASDIRWFADQYAEKLDTPLSVGQLAAALAIAGETGRANALFASAATTRRDEKYWADYGTDERDLAALVTMRAETSKDSNAALKLAESLERNVRNKKRWYWSTQEAAWLLMATHQLAKGGGEVQLRGAASYGPDSKPFRHALSSAELVNGYTIENVAKTPVRISAVVRGSPLTLQPAAQNGYGIERRILTMNGAPANLASVRQNDRLVIVLEGTKVDEGIGQSLITDLLPAGFEIETSFAGSRTNDDSSETPQPPAGAPAWLGMLTAARFQDARDDRFVAAIDFDALPSFRLAYVVRAITPGRFIQPGVMIEDMYKPQYFSRGAPGIVTVSAR